MIALGNEIVPNYFQRESEFNNRTFVSKSNINGNPAFSWFDPVTCAKQVELGLDYGRLSKS